MKIIIKLLLILISSFSLSCDTGSSGDSSHEYDHYKKVVLINKTDKSITVYYAEQITVDNGITVKQKKVVIPSNARKSVEIQYNIFSDGPLTIKYDYYIHTYDIDTSSGDAETIYIQKMDFYS
jgi:phage baseplate assembly protein gpV